jgi:hypothetical protein
LDNISAVSLFDILISIFKILNSILMYICVYSGVSAISY